jgi:hypothetical protein
LDCFVVHRLRLRESDGELTYVGELTGQGEVVGDTAQPLDGSEASFYCVHRGGGV